jgi:CRP-like cAMP-binding protein
MAFVQRLGLTSRVENMQALAGLEGIHLSTFEFSSVRNNILLSLHGADRERLAKHLTPIDLPLRLVLQTPEVAIEHCYFVESGVVSMVAVLADGAPIEIGVVGSEGLVGLPALLGAAKAPSLGIVQLPGAALRIETRVLIEAFDESPAIRKVILRYAQAMHTQVAQTAACNSRHDSEQRLARWLLMAHDRVQEAVLPLTQEFLSMMLGIRRQQVSLAAAALQKAGLINYRHGRIELLDRAGMEDVACECYSVVAGEHKRSLCSEAS